MENSFLDNLKAINTTILVSSNVGYMHRNRVLSSNYTSMVNELQELALGQGFYMYSNIADALVSLGLINPSDLLQRKNQYEYQRQY